MACFVARSAEHHSRISMYDIATHDKPFALPATNFTPTLKRPTLQEAERCFIGSFLSVEQDNSIHRSFLNLREPSRRDTISCYQALAWSHRQLQL